MVAILAIISTLCVYYDSISQRNFLELRLNESGALLPLLCGTRVGVVARLCRIESIGFEGDLQRQPEK